MYNIFFFDKEYVEEKYLLLVANLFNNVIYNKKLGINLMEAHKFFSISKILTHSLFAVNKSYGKSKIISINNYNKLLIDINVFINEK
jgi:hypothetical protein